MLFGADHALLYMDLVNIGTCSGVLVPEKRRHWSFEVNTCTTLNRFDCI